MKVRTPFPRKHLCKTGWYYQPRKRFTEKLGNTTVIPRKHLLKNW